jgi:hypothetical protein
MREKVERQREPYVGPVLTSYGRIVSLTHSGHGKGGSKGSSWVPPGLSNNPGRGHKG